MSRKTREQQIAELQARLDRLKKEQQAQARRARNYALIQIGLAVQQETGVSWDEVNIPKLVELLRNLKYNDDTTFRDRMRGYAQQQELLDAKPAADRIRQWRKTGVWGTAAPIKQTDERTGSDGNKSIKDLFDKNLDGITF